MPHSLPAPHVGRSPNRPRRAVAPAAAERAHAGAVVPHHPILLDSREDMEQIAAVEKVRAHAARLLPA